MTQPDPEFVNAAWQAIIENVQPPEVATAEDISAIKALAFAALQQTPAYIEADHEIATVHGTLELRSRCLNNKQFTGLEVIADLTKHTEIDLDTEVPVLPKPDLTITVGNAGITFKPPLAQIDPDDIAEYKLVLLEAYMSTTDVCSQLFYSHLSKLLEKRKPHSTAPILDGEFIETTKGMAPAVDMGCRTAMGANSYARSVQRRVAQTSPISQVTVTKKDWQEITAEGTQYNSLDAVQVEITQNGKRVVMLEMHEDDEVLVFTEQPHVVAELLEVAADQDDADEFLQMLGYTTLKAEYAKQLLSALETVVTAK